MNVPHICIPKTIYFDSHNSILQDSNTFYTHTFLINVYFSRYLNIMFLLSILLISLIQSLFAVELSIYKTFTEVRETQNGIGSIKYQFTNADYGNLIDGSINWQGTPFVRQEIYNTIQSLQDAQVTVRRTSTCGCEKIQAKIVDADSMLLQNLDTGAYFYADKESIEYSTIRPSEGQTTLSVEFESDLAARQGTLSYLMRGITWTPSYELLLTGKNGK